MHLGKNLSFVLKAPMFIRKKAIGATNRKIGNMKLFKEIELDQKQIEKFSKTGSLPLNPKTVVTLIVIGFWAFLILILPFGASTLQAVAEKNKPFHDVCIGNAFVSEPWWKQPHCNYWFISEDEAERYLKIHGRR